MSRKYLQATLECRKRYLKTRYQLHCYISSVHSHSISFALSGELPDVVSEDILSLFKAIQSVTDESKMHGTEDEQYDVNAAINNICLYIKHLIRDAQQKNVKTYCFD